MNNKVFSYRGAIAEVLILKFKGINSHFSQKKYYQTTLKWLRGATLTYIAILLIVLPPDTMPVWLMLTIFFGLLILIKVFELLSGEWREEKMWYRDIFFLIAIAFALFLFVYDPGFTDRTNRWLMTGYLVVGIAVTEVIRKKKLNVSKYSH